MKIRNILLLIGLSVFLISCTAEEPVSILTDTEPNSTTQIIEEDIELDEMDVLTFFAPGYDTFEDMVDASALIIRGRVLDERVEWVNVHTTLEEAIEARMEEYEAGLISREERDNQIAHHREHEEYFAPRYDDVIFYRVEILEIFQGDYEVGDIIEIFDFIRWDENGNPSLEHSNRHEVYAEFIFFLRDGGGLGYFAFHPHQSVYEVPADLDSEEDIDVVLDYIEEFQQNYIEFEGTVIDLSGIIPRPFEINLEMLREIAEDNDLLD